MYTEVSFDSCYASYRVTTGYTFMESTVLLHHFYTDNGVFTHQHCFLMAFLLASHVFHFGGLQQTPQFLLRISSHCLRYTHIYICKVAYTFSPHY